MTLLVESAAGYANLCRLLTAAHAGTRPKEGARAAAARARHPPARGAATTGSCASPAARGRGSPCVDPNAAARLARVFGRERFYVELQRPYERGDARRNAALARSRRDARRAHGRHGRRARARRAPRARCRTCSSRSAAARRSTAASASGAATTSACLPHRPTCSSVSRSTAVQWHGRARSRSGSSSTSPRSSATATPTSPTGPSPPTCSSAASASAPSRTATAQVPDCYLCRLVRDWRRSSR